MTAIGLTRLCAGRVHYAWIVLAVMFSATLAGVGVRAAPGVMILPLQRAFGWDVSTISGAVSVNIILLGVTAPRSVASQRGGASIHTEIPSRRSHHACYGARWRRLPKAS